MKLPQSQDQIPAALLQLRSLLRTQRAQTALTEAQIRVVQDLCTHPNTYIKYDYGGGSDSYCETCGKCI